MIIMMIMIRTLIKIMIYMRSENVMLIYFIIRLVLCIFLHNFNIFFFLFFFFFFLLLYLQIHFYSTILYYIYYILQSIWPHFPLIGVLIKLTILIILLLAKMDFL